MTAVAAKTEYTPDDLLAMPDEKDYELVGGELVERNVIALSSWVGGKIVILLGNYLIENPIGLVFNPESGYRCFPDAPNKVRKPDASVISSARLPGDWQQTGYFRIAPDLAVEVLSPNDLAVEVDEKLLEYQRAGVPLVWVINPAARVVRVHRADFTSNSLTEDDELSGEGVLPGFRCRVRSLFPPPAAVAPDVTGR